MAKKDKKDKKDNKLDASYARESKLLQIRTDALSAEYIYRHELNKISFVTTAITALTILVPVVITLALVWAKGTDYEQLMNGISYILHIIWCVAMPFYLQLNIQT